MSMNIVPQIDTTVKKHLNNKIELLALADHALEQFNRYWASWIVTGDNTAYRLALAARQDRADLLAQVGGGP
jgi:hypothetical protein